MMARCSVPLTGGRTLEDAVAAVLTTARATHFKAAIPEFGVKKNPFALKPTAARIPCERSTLHGWESCRFRPRSLEFYRRWARAVESSFAIIIDGDAIGKRHEF